MMLNWNRVWRTAVQSASGAAVALITAISANFERGAIIAAVVEFATTVVVAVCMNINRQAREADKYGDDET